MDVNLHSINFDGNVSTFSVEFKEAYNLYINYGQHIIGNNLTDLLLPKVLLGAPIDSTDFEYKIKINQHQRYLYFLIANGNRDIR